MDYKEQNLLWTPTKVRNPKNDTSCLITVKFGCRHYDLKKDNMSSDLEYKEYQMFADYINGDWEFWDIWGEHPAMAENMFHTWFSPTEPIGRSDDILDLTLLEKNITNNGHSGHYYFVGKKYAQITEYEVTAFVELPDENYDENCRICAANGGENCDECEKNLEREEQ